MKWVLKTSTLRVATSQKDFVSQSIEDLPPEWQEKVLSTLRGPNCENHLPREPGSLRPHRPYHPWPDAGHESVRKHALLPRYRRHSRNPRRQGRWGAALGELGRPWLLSLSGRRPGLAGPQPNRYTVSPESSFG